MSYRPSDKVLCRIVFRMIDDDTFEIVFEGEGCKEVFGKHD